MKIRNGFVSNSSSSNFIVGSSSIGYSTLFDLAQDMLLIRNNDFDDYVENKAQWDEEINAIHKAIKEQRDPNTSIYFHTCNYNTFIKKIYDYYVVTSCNNHMFTERLRGIVNCPQNVKNWLDEKGYLVEDDIFPFSEKIRESKFQSGEIFWSPIHDIEISLYDYHGSKEKKVAEEFCKKDGHFSDMIVLASTKEIICPICYSQGHKNNKEQPINSRWDIIDI
jgi:hypothetical protein